MKERKDCLGNIVTNFVAKTFNDGDKKSTELHSWLSANVFSSKHTAVRVYEGTETLRHLGKNEIGKEIITSSIVKKHIGWNLVVA